MPIYLICIAVPASTGSNRVAEVAHATKKIFDHIATSIYPVPVLSGDRKFVFLIESSRNAKDISSILSNGTSSDDGNLSSAIRNDETSLVIECSNGIAGQGLSGVVAWAQGRIRQTTREEARTSAVPRKGGGQSQLTSQLASIKSKLDKDGK